MGHILVVAEKPSVGRDIASALGCRQKGDGYIFNDTHVITWAIGHLVILAEPHEYDVKYKKWSIDTLPIIPTKMKLKPYTKTKKQFDIIKKFMNATDTDQIICATDSGREGELIFRYIYELAKCKKPVMRLWISSLTDTAILNGFKNIKPSREYDNLYASARCRSEADWLVGMNASRAYSIRYDALLSIGRVQTPTLAMITDRQIQINSFISRDYWEIHVAFDDYKGIWIDKTTRESKILDKQKALDIQQKVHDEIGYVTDIKSESKRQPPPLLYDLTELQREANRKFGYTAKNTLDIAQSLYEKRKMITYPRTDSRYISQDIVPKLRGVLERFISEPYHSFVQDILASKNDNIHKRMINDEKITDHHAMIPTDARQNIESLSTEEFKIYDLIVRRFLAAFSPDYEYLLTKIDTEVRNELFLSKGKRIIHKGWMNLYENDVKKEDDEQELPTILLHEMKKVMQDEIKYKKTQPPSPYTEGTLLSAMENAGRFVEDEALKEQLKESGLGTPATRATIIERLITVGYIERKGKSLLPTDKGNKLIQIIPHEMKSPETTGKWEKALTSIAKGQMATDRFMESITRYIHYFIHESIQKKEDIYFEKENKKPAYTHRRKSNQK